MKKLPRIIAVVAAGLLSAALLGADGRRMSFEERVEAQRALEGVYYAHQIGATEPFDLAVPRVVLEDKVRAYLKETVALERFWSTPITAQALEDELERMARRSKLPGRLREIYDALAGDPVLIQECLARPALVDRLARSFFATDARIHAAARREAEDLRRRLIRGQRGVDSDDETLTVVELRRAIPGAAVRPAGRASRLREKRDNAITREVESAEFSRWRARLPQRPGEVGGVEEEREAFVVRVLVAQRPDRLTFESYSVRKVEWDDW